MMLLDRAAPGDAERARAMLVAAGATYGRLGMPRHVALVANRID